MPKFINGLPPRQNRILRIIWGFLAMVLIAFGIYLEVVADIGLSPWDAFNQGLSIVLPITIGFASISVGSVIIVIDLILGEKIGFGTLLDTFCIGSILDIFNYIDPLPHYDSIIYKIILFIAALFILAVGMYFYMSIGLSCGPRDTLMVAIGKRFRKNSVGFITTVMYVCVLAAAWALGATLGVGTILALTLSGLIIDFVFGLFRFEPRDVVHENVIDTVNVIIKNR